MMPTDRAYDLGVRLLVWGERACFCRPEIKTQRVSYDVMTPLAARGVLEAIYWKASFRWSVDRIHVLDAIQFSTVEASSLRPEEADFGQHDLRRPSIVLVDVAYVIEAHIEQIGEPDNDNNPVAHHARFGRAVRSGRCHHTPFLGLPGCPAEFALLKTEDAARASLFPPEPREIDLGWMVHDIDYDHGHVMRFFRAILVNGVLEIPKSGSASLAG
jgi:CRISPR-associated protein Cas5d